MQNSDTLILHMDSSSKDFGKEYLAEMKGIDLSVFDTVLFEPLLDEFGGFFESFIVTTYNGARDTLWLKDPILVEHTLLESRDNQIQTPSCVISNRTTVYHTDSTIVLVDYLFGNSIEMKMENGQVSVCRKSFELNAPIPDFLDHLASDYNVDFSLTKRMWPLLVQLNMAGVRVSSVSLSGDEPLAIMSLPYVYKEKKDTVISDVGVVLNAEMVVRGIINFSDEKLEKAGYYIDSDLGFYMPSANTLWLPIVSDDEEDDQNHKLGHFRKNENGRFQFESFLKPPNSNASMFADRENFRLANEILFNHDRGVFIDLGTETIFDFHDAVNAEHFHLYDVIVSDHESRDYVLVYEAAGVLSIANFHSHSVNPQVLFETGIHAGEYPVLLEDGLYFLKYSEGRFAFRFIPWASGPGH